MLCYLKVSQLVYYKLLNYSKLIYVISSYTLNYHKLFYPKYNNLKII
jgi:hypothetical protein